jgi:hypothetical protein
MMVRRQAPAFCFRGSLSLMKYGSGAVHKIMSVVMFTDVLAYRKVGNW